MTPLPRRRFLQGAAALAAALAVPGPARRSAAAPALGPLGGPDANGLRLPPGFTSRVVAAGRAVVEGTGHTWHPAADGGATFTAGDGGWIYVSNSEIPIRGGAGALRFSADGTLADAYPILTGTSMNCAGGPTPWGTWLSCEEHEGGRVWECDPHGDRPPVARDALGRFPHEAAAVDPATGIVYLTEDRPDGLLYRFVPDSAPGPDSLAAGRLEAARAEAGGSVSWVEVPPGDGFPRHRVPGATAFARGEGAWFGQGRLYFCTTADARVWVLDPAAGSLGVLHQGGSAGSPLGGPDNVTVSPAGLVVVAEDGGDMELVVIDPADGVAAPLLQVTGHSGSEIAGPAFDPSGTRLYFSSQRGGDAGITYEVTGPFGPPIPEPASPATTSPTTGPNPAAAGGGGGDGDALDGAVTVAAAGALGAAAAGAGILAWRKRGSEGREGGGSPP